MSLATNDTFTDTTGTLLQSHTGETGAAWTKCPGFSGDAEVTAANRLRGQSANALYYSSGVPASADYDVEADLYVASNAGQAGVLGRQSTSATTYYLFDFESSSGNFTLYTVVAGATLNTRTYSAPQSVGTTLRMRLSMRGTLITCYINGIQAMQITDSNIAAAGRGGLYFSSANTDTTGYHLDNFQVSTPAATIPVWDSSLFFSPYTWCSDGAGSLGQNNIKGSSTYALAQNCGAYGKFSLTAVGNGFATLLLDTTPLSGITAANCPTLYISIDGQPLASWLLAYSALPFRVLLGGALAAGNHTVEWWIKSIDTTSTNSMGDRWNNLLVAGASAVKVTGVEIDGKGSASYATLPMGKNLLIFADSMAEGVNAIGAGNTNASSDATQAFPLLLGLGLVADVGSVGFAGQGLAASFGYGNVPKIIDTVTPSNSTWNQYWSGKSRLVNSLFSPAPDYVLIVLGKNDASLAASDASVTAAMTALMLAIRAAAPNAWIFVCVPFDQSKLSAITAGFNAARDNRTRLVNLGAIAAAGMASGGNYTVDGVHPNVRGHASFSPQIVQQMQSVLSFKSPFGASGMQGGMNG